MLVPVFPNTKFVENDGYLTDTMLFYITELNQNLQNSLSNNGWTVPQLTQLQISDIYLQMPDGTLFYDTTNNLLVVKINGALEKVTTTAYP